VNRLMSRTFRMLFEAGVGINGGDAIRLGSPYGGWHVPAGGIRSDAVVYSAGLGEDASFDLELIRRYGCRVWVFDPTPRAVAYARTVDEERFSFLPVGLWSSDGPQVFFPPKNPVHVSHSITNSQKARSPGFEAICRSLPSLMRELGHSHIDLLKLDIEGAEYQVLDPIARAEITPSILAVEFHPASLSQVRRTFRLVRRLKSLGYSVLAREGQNVTFVATSPVDAVRDQNGRGSSR
jgi:FkbM family methyltransferase